VDSKKLKEFARIAKDAVAELEEPYRSIAFKEFLDRLLTEKQTQSIQEKIKSARPGTSQECSVAPAIETLCSKINRTDYPEIKILKKAKARALLVLKLARDEANSDGLTATQISDILDKLFRLRVTKYAINMALGEETVLVDRKPIRTKGGQAYVYRIMAPGEDYLANLMKVAKRNESE